MCIKVSQLQNRGKNSSRFSMIIMVLNLSNYKIPFVLTGMLFFDTRVAGSLTGFCSWETIEMTPCTVCITVQFVTSHCLLLLDLIDCFRIYMNQFAAGAACNALQILLTVKGLTEKIMLQSVLFFLVFPHQ
ncbi:hypothetical protein FKM82_019115 [Ascaphus truei]